MTIALRAIALFLRKNERITRYRTIADLHAKVRGTHLTLPSKLLPFYLTVRPCVKGGSIPNTYPPPLPVFGFAQFFPFVDVYSATVFFVFCANFRYSLSKRKRDSAKKTRMPTSAVFYLD